MSDIASLLEQFGRTTGDYWSHDNAKFESTNPGLGDRLARSFNPLTGLGSALGAMHDAAGQGNPRDMGIALLQALPLYGVAGKTASSGIGAVRATVSASPDVGAWVAKALLGGLASAAVDQAQAGSQQFPDKRSP